MVNIISVIPISVENHSQYCETASSWQINLISWVTFTEHHKHMHNCISFALNSWPSLRVCKQT